MKKNSGSKKSHHKESKGSQPDKKNKEKAEKKPLLVMVKENPYITGFFVVLGVLLILDFVVRKHEPVSIGNVPEFYAVYGFVSAVVLVFTAKILGALFGQSGKR